MNSALIIFIVFKYISVHIPYLYCSRTEHVSCIGEQDVALGRRRQEKRVMEINMLRILIFSGIMILL